MIAEIGRFALSLALALVLAQMLCALIGTRRDAAIWEALSRRAAALVFVSLAASFACLITVFVQSDFSVENVFMNSHSAKPLGYKIAGAWGSHEGSMVMWCAGLAGYSAALAHFYRGPLATRALIAAGGVLVLFLVFTIFASNPFDRMSPVPLEGRGLNPLLQDPALAAHPPLLYLGLTGLLAPFALSVAALWRGRSGKEWAQAARPWTLAAFTALTVGITLGSYWAYYELGWGGWWFWDPVENASLMPWLLTAALLHSLVVSAGRNALTGWSLFLSISAFSLAMLGLFLTRSGVLTSVHAFALDPRRGVLLLSILAVAGGGALALFALRAPNIFKEKVKFDPVSREGALILNNALLTMAAAIVLLGTLYPLILRTASGDDVAVGGPYFELTVGPVMALALLILPVAPFLRWRQGGWREARRRLLYGGIGALAALAGIILIARDAPLGAAVTAALAVWVMAGALSDFAAQRRQPGTLGRGLAHFGVGLFLLGAAGDTGFSIERSTALTRGESFEAAGRTVTLETVRRADGANYLADEGVLTVTGSGRQFQMTPERRYFPTADQTTTEVALRRSLLGDYYVALGQARERENGEIAWVIRASNHPLVWMVFAGAFLTAAGGLVSTGSHVRRKRRAS